MCTGKLPSLAALSSESMRCAHAALTYSRGTDSSHPFFVITTHTNFSSHKNLTYLPPETSTLSVVPLPRPPSLPASPASPFVPFNKTRQRPCRNEKRTSGVLMDQSVRISRLLSFILRRHRHSQLEEIQTDLNQRK